MDRYCVEMDEKGRQFTLHHQKCFAFSHAELIPSSRVLDVGAHRSPEAAQTQARRHFASLKLCPYCCDSRSRREEGGRRLRV